MNQQKFGVRTWLWLVLAVVVVAALGYIGWYYQFGGKTTPTTSPSPTQSAVISPSPGATTTPAAGGGGKTSTPSGGQTSTSTTPTNIFELTLGKYIGCVPTISFQLPEGYGASPVGGTPMTGGAIWGGIGTEKERNGADYSIFISALAYSAPMNYQTIVCVSPPYSNLQDYASRNNIANYSSLTANGIPAIQYSSVDGKKHTVVRNSDKNIIDIVLNKSSATDVYDIILNSFQFK